MLDTPTSAGGNIHVVYLKNAEAVKLAETLRAIYRGEAAPAAAPRGRDACPSRHRRWRTAPARRRRRLGRPQALAAAPGIIQADAATNSIIITAPDAIYNNLRAALDKLDVRRAQVYVEALIAEVTADKAAEFGVQWQSLSGLGQERHQGVRRHQFRRTRARTSSASRPNPASAGRGLNVGVINGTVTIPGVGADPQPQPAGARAGDATPTPTSCPRRRC